MRAGKYTLLYRVDAGLSDEVKAETDGGAAPGGSIVAEITPKLPETEVNDTGEIVEIGSRSGKKRA